MLGKAAESGQKGLEICSRQALGEHFWRVPLWFYKQHLGALRLSEVSQPLTGAAWPTVSSLGLWKHCHSLILIFTAILQIWGIVLYFAEIEGLLYGKQPQCKVSLGNGFHLLFSIRPWSITVMREYFPSETGDFQESPVWLWVWSVQDRGVVPLVPQMAPPGFCRQIELTNVVAFPQQGKVHLFRVKNPTTKQAEVLALSPRQINDSIWISDRGWQTSHTRCPWTIFSFRGAASPACPAALGMPAVHVENKGDCFRVRALPPKAALAGWESQWAESVVLSTKSAKAEHNPGDAVCGKWATAHPQTLVFLFTAALDP